MTKEKLAEDLKSLLSADPKIENALRTSLREAGRTGIETIGEFYDFIERILTHVPTEKSLIGSVREFYYILSKSPGNILYRSEAFNRWIQEVVTSRGDWLDTTDSAKDLQSFVDNPEYNIDDYIKGPSGWLTFNQFLARQLKPGKRPVAERCNNNIITSPADCEYQGQWLIEKDAHLTVKGNRYSIDELLSGSDYAESFAGGVFTHGFLAITDYHRFHVPADGTIKEVKNIPGHTWITEAEKPGGTLENIDDVGFQFKHTRGLVIIESAVGHIALIPVGMGHISSVVLTCEPGTQLCKGDEFGYFAFGGSDIILLFEANRVNLSTEKNKYYKMGEQIGTARSF